MKLLPEWAQDFSVRGFCVRRLKRSEIQTRLSAVSELTDSILRDKIRHLLKEISDLERLIGRLNLGTASPRDLTRSQPFSFTNSKHKFYVIRRNFAFASSFE